VKYVLYKVKHMILMLG